MSAKRISRDSGVNDISLYIGTGEFVFVVGDSGSGKSTLIKLLLKELEPTEGTIKIGSEDLGSITHRQIPKFRRKIGVVFQTSVCCRTGTFTRTWPSH